MKDIVHAQKTLCFIKLSFLFSRDIHVQQMLLEQMQPAFIHATRLYSLKESAGLKVQR